MEALRSDYRTAPISEQDRAMLDEHTAGTADRSPVIWNMLMLCEWAKLFMA